VSKLMKLSLFNGFKLDLLYVGCITPICFRHLKQKDCVFPGIITSNLEEERIGELTTGYTDMAVLLSQKLRKAKLFDTSSWTLGVRVRKQRDLWLSDAPPECSSVLISELLTRIFSQGLVRSISDYLIPNKT
jgi:hypothetical protein